ncbi:hypothetical protein JXA88_07595 [Candidatus Fermentibacteria bacterium]|nr:hypothetical protein [Candidatus Fermentibacteria bacterium]
MFQSTLRTRFAILAVVGILAFTASAEIPLYVSYQGKVTDTSGNPVADGSYNMRFRVYNASSGGTMLWDSGTRSFTLSGGVFNVLLGESPQPALNLDFSVDYWLLVTFEGTDQSPRQRLTSNGYSYMASGVVPGTEVAGAIAASYVLKATNTATSGTNSGLYGQSASTAGFGVYGYATAGSGTTYGVCGVSNSTVGRGVYGGVGAGSGITYGVQGNSSSADGRGVFGEATHASGTNYGVFGQTNSPGGTGVYGMNGATSGSTEGVYGEVASTAGSGVYGLAYSGSGTTNGVYGHAYSVDGRGVFGKAESSTGSCFGVHGESKSPAGAGVYGNNTATVGSTEGVYGEAASSAGRGVYGLAYSSAGTTFGVHGQTYSNSSNAAGVFGEYGGVALADVVGVYGKSDPGDYYGVGVKAEGGWKGVYADVTASTSGTYYGVHGHAAGPTDLGIVYGVYGEAVGGATHYGVYYSGGLGGVGAMKSIVRTDDAPVALYGHLTTENWFEDFGSGTIQDGRAMVLLADDFRKVSAASSLDLKVFITPNAQIGEWWVEKTGLSFTLHAPTAADGSSFDYRVVVRRPGSENLRLEAAPEGYLDRALYTDASEVPAQYRAEWVKRAALEARSTDAQ